MSRFLRRPKPPVDTTPAEPLPEPTSELIVRPHKDAKIPIRAPHSAAQLTKLAELEEWTRELHKSTLKEEDAYWKWEERWLSDPTLYARYLRASKWDVSNAKKRIQATLEWRREFKPDLLVPDDVKIEGETGKHVISGFDRQGRALLYMRPGRENTQPSERQIRYVVWSMERAIDFLPPGQETICLIIDYKSATMANNPSFSTSLKVLNILQHHYVERLGRAYVSSVPWFINAFFNAIQPFLDPVTRDKIRFNAHLPEYIPPEQLDTEWKGGRYNYVFDKEVYWNTLLDHCGIAPDGTRTHESKAKELKVPFEEDPASADSAKSEAKEEEKAGQTLSTFMSSKKAEGEEADENKEGQGETKTDAPKEDATTTSAGPTAAPAPDNTTEAVSATTPEAAKA